MTIIQEDNEVILNRGLKIGQVKWDYNKPFNLSTLLCFVLLF